VIVVTLREISVLSWARVRDAESRSCTDRSAVPLITATVRMPPDEYGVTATLHLVGELSSPTGGTKTVARRIEATVRDCAGSDDSRVGTHWSLGLVGAFACSCVVVTGGAISSLLTPVRVGESHAADRARRLAARVGRCVVSNPAVRRWAGLLCWSPRRSLLRSPCWSRRTRPFAGVANESGYCLDWVGHPPPGVSAFETCLDVPGYCLDRACLPGREFRLDLHSVHPPVHADSVADPSALPPPYIVSGSV
jgi:hypothetical protein